MRTQIQFFQMYWEWILGFLVSQFLIMIIINRWVFLTRTLSCTETLLIFWINCRNFEQFLKQLESGSWFLKSRLNFFNSEPDTTVMNPTHWFCLKSIQHYFENFISLARIISASHHNLLYSFKLALCRERFFRVSRYYWRYFFYRLYLFSGSVFPCK